MNSLVLRDGALFLLRAVLGIVFIAHGVDKMFFPSIDDTIGQFALWNVPQPQVLAWAAALGEMIGGAMLIVGFLTTLAAGLLAVLCAAAIYLVNAGNGFFAHEQGIEFPLVLAVSLLMIVVFGAGRASLDEVLSRVDA
ncbi:MAG: DoxX family protein [Corynebacterium sp.]|nr:DoxX family protein [Corynebacterium sp.]